MPAKTIASSSGSRKRLTDEILTETNEMIAEHNFQQIYRIIHPCDEREPSGCGSFLRLLDYDFFKVQMAEKSAERINIQHLDLKCCLMSRYYLAGGKNYGK